MTDFFTMYRASIQKTGEFQKVCHLLHQGYMQGLPERSEESPNLN
jgi:hypothetical protein